MIDVERSDVPELGPVPKQFPAHPRKYINRHPPRSKTEVLNTIESLPPNKPHYHPNSPLLVAHDDEYERLKVPALLRILLGPERLYPELPGMVPQMNVLCTFDLSE